MSVIGDLVLATFVFLAVGMAAVAINHEERLAPRERQLLQQQR